MWNSYIILDSSNVIPWQNTKGYFIKKSIEYIHILGFILDIQLLDCSSFQLLVSSLLVTLLILSSLQHRKTWVKCQSWPIFRVKHGPSWFWNQSSWALSLTNFSLEVWPIIENLNPYSCLVTQTLEPADGSHYVINYFGAGKPWV